MKCGPSSRYARPDAYGFPRTSTLLLVDRAELEDAKATDACRKFEQDVVTNGLAHERLADWRGQGDVTFVKVFSVGENQEVGLLDGGLLALDDHSRPKPDFVDRNLGDVNLGEL